MFPPWLANILSVSYRERINVEIIYHYICIYTYERITVRK